MTTTTRERAECGERRRGTDEISVFDLARLAAVITAEAWRRGQPVAEVWRALAGDQGRGRGMRERGES